MPCKNISPASFQHLKPHTNWVHRLSSAVCFRSGSRSCAALQMDDHVAVGSPKSVRFLAETTIWPACRQLGSRSFAGSVPPRGGFPGSHSSDLDLPLSASPVQSAASHWGSSPGWEGVAVLSRSLCDVCARGHSTRTYRNLYRGIEFIGWQRRQWSCGAFE